MAGQYTRKDFYYLKAKEENYRSRAAYKLLELQKRFSLLKQDMKVLEMGTFPGGWLQVTTELVGRHGVVVGVDLQKVQPLKSEELVRCQRGVPEMFCFEGDVSDEHRLDELITSTSVSRFDLILSDMSPHLSGIKFRDVAKSAQLIERVFCVANRWLRSGGSIATKVFPGHDTDNLYKKFSGSFQHFDRVCLKSSRQSSNEYYLVGRCFAVTP